MLWTEGLPIDNKTIVYVQHDQIESASLELSCGMWPKVEKIVTVLPTGYTYVEVIDVLVRIQVARAGGLDPANHVNEFMVQFYSVSSTMRDIVRAACDLLDGLRRFDPLTISSAGARLEAEVSGSNMLPLRSQRLLIKLAQFVTEFGNTSLHEWSLPAFFFHDRAAPENRNWWKKPSSLAVSFRRADQRFLAILTGLVPPSFQSVRDWIKGFREEADGLWLSPTSLESESDVFRKASAFMAAMADVHHINRRYVLALLCLHRAVEWMLAAKCSDQNMLDFTSRQGPRMASGRQDLISFDLLLTSLTNQGIGLNGMVADLATLNSWRNLFAYTHHMSSPNVATAESLYANIRPNLPYIANSKWKNAVSALREPWPVSLEDMLDPTGEIRDAYAIHSPSNLKF